MIVKVYKSLDKSHSSFGLVGSYMGWMVIAVVVSIVVGVIFAVLLSGLVGILLFVVLAALSYIGIVHMQGKFTEREREKWFVSMSLPDVIRVRPVRLDTCGEYRLMVKDGKPDKKKEESL